MWHWLMRHPSVAANEPATLHGYVVDQTRLAEMYGDKNARGASFRPFFR